jgi:putative transposase
MEFDAPFREIGRRKPPQGVRVDLGERTIIFVTVCTKDRVAWLACEEAHQLICKVWQRSQAWLVGDYVLMPDHLHLFAAPRDLRFTADAWIQYWKSQFSKGHRYPHWRWQSKAVHHRLRDSESYTQKWHYMRENPLRAGLVKDPEEWPYRGTVFPLGW